MYVIQRKLCTFFHLFVYKTKSTKIEGIPKATQQQPTKSRISIFSCRCLFEIDCLVCMTLDWINPKQDGSKLKCLPSIPKLTWIADQPRASKANKRLISTSMESILSKKVRRTCCIPISLYLHWELEQGDH